MSLFNDPAFRGVGVADADNLAAQNHFREPTKMVEPDWPTEDPGAPPPDEPDESPPDGTLPDSAVDGAQFILDQPAEVAAIWGEGPLVAWAPGEALMIAGPQGVGKTTLAGLLIRGLLGLVPSVLGLPVAEFRGRVLYLAMDRPRQISRSLRRQFEENDRPLLATRLVVRPGPPMADLAGNPTLLMAMAEQYQADVVFVDSLKDAAVGLTDDTVAASWNRARQHVLASGRQICELHHVIKRNSRDQAGSAVDAIYGSTWLTSGCGSIVLLSGEPGDPIVGFRHVKQPAEEIGPFRLLHDQDSGVLSIEHGVDLIELVKATGPDGLTAKGAAQATTEKSNPSRAEVEKARRKLDKLVTDEALVCIEGIRGGGEIRTPTAYFLAAHGNHGHSRPEENPQVSPDHALFDGLGNHDSHTPNTADSETAGQSGHAINHAIHAAGNHVSPGPLGPVNGTPIAESADGIDQ